MHRLAVVFADEPHSVEGFQLGSLQVLDLLVHGRFARFLRFFRLFQSVFLPGQQGLHQRQPRRIRQRSLVGTALHQRLVLGIFHVRRVRGHEGAEQAVDQIHDFLFAAEVAVEVDHLSVWIGPCLVSAVAVQEQFRLCQPEFIDALLYVSHHEDVVRTGHPLDEFILHQVAVLVFIHEDAVELFPVFAADLFVLQDAQRKVFYIREIQ